MKALQIRAPREVALVDVPEPTLTAPDQVKVRLRAASICNRHEWKTYAGHYRMHFRFPYPQKPGYPGHEACGEVVEAGSAVKNVAVGDSVFLTSHAGELHKEYTVCPAGWAFRVEPGTPAADAAPLELFACAVGLISTAPHVPGGRCAVIGMGPGGQSVIQVLRAFHAAEITAIDLVDARLEAALSMGADRAVDARDTDAIERLAQEAPETAIDCSGSHDGFRLASRLAAREALLFGYNDEPFEVVQAEWFVKRLVIRTGNIIEQETGRRTAALLKSGLIRPSALVTHRVPFSVGGYVEAMDLIERRECLKVLMEH